MAPRTVFFLLCVLLTAGVLFGGNNHRIARRIVGTETCLHHMEERWSFCAAGSVRCPPVTLLTWVCGL